MKVYLFDTESSHTNLLPLSFTRPIAAFRCGILTIKEKWEKVLSEDCKYLPVEYLQQRFGTVENDSEISLFIAGNLLPDESLIDFIKSLQPGEVLIKDHKPLIFLGIYSDFKIFRETACRVSPEIQKKAWKERTYNGNFDTINFVYDIFLLNYQEICKDFELLTKGRKSQVVPNCTKVFPDDENAGNGQIFIEEGAVIECVSINVKDGPVYIGKDVVLMEGACVRGPLALCEGSEVRMGAKIYGGTTIGPYCKVGGEIDNSVLFGYSNKAHDGYLGNAVIGEWCNVGAGVNASNLKNDYSMIRVWNYKIRSFMKTDLQFCGLIMGDHSKIGVNCMINTATVLGVGVNIHGCGFPRTYIPNFYEGSPSSGFTKMPFKKFTDVVERVMARREIIPSEAGRSVYEYIYSLDI